MPNPFHYRAKIDRLWRRTAEHNPGYIRLKALNTIVRELIAPTPQARLNHQLYLAADPYDVARHKLRDLYDRAELCTTSPLGGGAPHPCGVEGAAPTLTQVAPAQAGAAPTEEESPEEDDDPL